MQPPLRVPSSASEAHAPQCVVAVAVVAAVVVVVVCVWGGGYAAMSSSTQPLREPALAGAPRSGTRPLMEEARANLAAAKGEAALLAYNSAYMMAGSVTRRLEVLPLRRAPWW